MAHGNSPRFPGIPRLGNHGMRPSSANQMRRSVTVSDYQNAMGLTHYNNGLGLSRRLAFLTGDSSWDTAQVLALLVSLNMDPYFSS